MLGIAIDVINYLLVYRVLFQIKIKKDIQSWIVGMGIISLLYMLLEQQLGTNYLYIISIFAMIFVPIFFLEQERKSYLLYPFLVIACNTIAIGIYYIFSMLIGDCEQLNVWGISQIYFSKLILIFVLVVLYFWRKIRKYGDIFIQLDWKQYVLFYMGAICSLSLMVSVYEICKGENLTRNIKIYVVVVSITCIAFICLSIWQGIVVYRKIQLQEQCRAQQEYLDIEKNYFENILKQDENIRRFRHDMISHCLVLTDFCERGENQKIKQYIEQMLNETISKDNDIKTGNSTMDAVLRQYKTVCNKENINLCIEGKVSNEIKIKDFDLCTIISNILKNAVECCVQFEDERKKKINFQVKEFDGNINITVKNPIEHEVYIKENQPISRKQDKYNSGLGSGNIKIAIEKYRGEIKYQNKSGWFVVEVYI